MRTLLNEPLKDHTSYKIGGKTPKMFVVSQVSDFDKISDGDLRQSYILGGGTNILVSDNGIANPVIKIDIKFSVISHMERVLTVGAGVPLTEMAKKTAREGYEGLVHLAGIPGTIGGAVIMNASASHGAISDYLISVEAYNKETRERKIFLKENCSFGFRSSIFQNSPWIVTFARFQLQKGDNKELLKLYREIIDYREKNYPLGFPSAGCWFKRDWGGREIIEKIGMSGVTEGGALVSPLFPAFILNTGNATAKEVYSLVRQIQEKARGINEEMPCEIVTWGEI